MRRTITPIARRRRIEAETAPPLPRTAVSGTLLAAVAPDSRKYALPSGSRGATLPAMAHPAPAASRCTSEEFFELVARGVLAPDDRVELPGLDGLHEARRHRVGEAEAPCGEAQALSAGFDEAVGDQALEVWEGGVELDAEAAPEPFEVDADRLAEPGEAELAACLRGAEPLLGRDRRPALADGDEVAPGQPLVRPAPPGRRLGAEGVRPGAEPQVVRAIPVARVVARGEAGAGEARDLVALVPSCREPLDRTLRHGGLAVLVDGTEPAARAPGMEGGARLVGERVGGDVLGRERERGPEVVLPVGERLARHGEDQVEAQVGEAGGPRCLHRGADVGRAVVAAERPQMPGVERLRAQREAVHARGAVARQALARDGARVRLDRHLGAVGNAEAARDGLEHGRDRPGREERRRAAAQVDALRAPRAPLRALGPSAELRRHGVHVRALGRLRRRVHVEVAVRADVPAPRHVHVEREGLRRHASAASARSSSSTEPIDTSASGAGGPPSATYTVRMPSWRAVRRLTARSSTRMQSRPSACRSASTI